MQRMLADRLRRFCATRATRQKKTGQRPIGLRPVVIAALLYFTVSVKVVVAVLLEVSVPVTVSV
jgi:hypothetical protein